MSNCHDIGYLPERDCCVIFVIACTRLTVFVSQQHDFHDVSVGFVVAGVRNIEWLTRCCLRYYGFEVKLVDGYIKPGQYFLLFVVTPTSTDIDGSICHE
ncbi:hypothetical protein HSBGL_2815 [Halapricum desulfuricans]|uniref:Uncharacterized protein n=1 Tax=Halapricum desulfuricans TaxID=2841257 RepID=A0A897NQV6_9EURY|nr:hypothetical protein HSBGL_2815 [Halapricum desulfuricans]